jgi:hypothetical protein
MSIATECIRALTYLQGMQPATFIYDGETYDCLYSSQVNSADLGLGGFDERIDMRMWVIATDLPEEVTFGDTEVTFGDDTITWGTGGSGVRTVGQKITRTGKPYRVIRVERGYGYYRFDLATAKK